MTDIAITYPADLPVSVMREEIAGVIAANQVIIVAGATGSGKTTQLPKICLELGRESIGHTQPRRLAARTIAERIAQELGEEVGGLVGYQVRFTDHVGPHTRIKLMTDGILLNEIHRDRMLRKYDTIIIDEAHERSLTIDFLLGYLKQLLPRRPELKLIITSATIDPESFARHFATADGTPAPIVEVSGRTYPVEIRYRPLVDPAASSGTEDEGESVDRDYLEGINAALDELARESNGDVLVFLSGEAEIRDAEESIRGKFSAGSGTEVLPLYGRLSSKDQHKVFETTRMPGVRRRVVLATNVAETSLTVPGIRYVIDAGTARISRYSVRSKVQRLPIEAISQASANQRSGRSGRTSNGIAIRLYSEEDFAGRPEYTEPEILRTNLAAVILHMIALGLGDISAFPFLQPPDSRGIKDGLDLLTELGAILRGKEPESISLTKVGRDLAKLPIDPRFARMVLESKRYGTAREVLAIVAGMTIQDPRERPLDRRPQADQHHARFADPTSDFITLLNLWNYLDRQQHELSSSAFRRLCKAEYLNYLRVREWRDVYRQLKRLAKPLGLTVGERSVNPDGIHRSLLAGLLSHIGVQAATQKHPPQKHAAQSGHPRARGSEYIGARQARFVLFPGSTLAKKPPAVVMSAELVETSRLFARTNAAIDPAWAESIAGDLVRRSFGEPHWEKKQGSVVAYERVTLFGVPIIERRRVQFAQVDPGYARELFIRHALVDGEWDLERVDRRISAFDRANRALRAELAEVEERSRRRDILLDDEAVFDFYDRRIPPDVNSTRSFETWWRSARSQDPELLTMTADVLVPEDVPGRDQDAFPAAWRQRDQTLPVSYHFEPGSADDGVTVRVPLALLARLGTAGFDWQVPGFRAELVTALLRSLPKAIRRNFVPAADWSTKLLAELDAELADVQPHEGAEVAGFVGTLAAAMKRLTGVPVTATDFDLERVPDHLQIAFQVVDDRGRQLAGGRDLRVLQQRLKAQVRESVARASDAVPNGIERNGISTWDFDELPRHIDTRRGDTVIRAYPTLIDEGSTAGIRVMSTAEDQAASMPAGVRRMLMNATPSPIAYVQQHLTSAEKLTLAQSPYRTTSELFEDCLIACIEAVLRRARPDGQIFMRAEFESIRDRVSAVIMDAMFGAVSEVTRTIAAGRLAEKAIAQATSLAVLPALTDVRAQLSNLIYPGFVSAAGTDQLRRMPVYLTGIVRRLSALPDNPGRDRVWMNEVRSATDHYLAAGGVLPLPTLQRPGPASSPSANLVHARWMLEELRLSLFAQQLGTTESVSLKRIQKVLAST